MAFWDEEREIITFPKNERGEEIRVKAVSKKGREFIDIRTFYPGKDDMLPGKGVSIPRELSGPVAEAILAEVKVGV